MPKQCRAQFRLARSLTNARQNRTACKQAYAFEQDNQSKRTRDCGESLDPKANSADKTRYAAIIPQANNS